MVVSLDPPTRHGIREAVGSDRPAPGILCWNCRNLTPFPAETCKWCGAAFAGSHGGAYADALPERSMRVHVSTPAGPARPGARVLQRMIRRLERKESTVDSGLKGRGVVPSASLAAKDRRASRKSVDLLECPVCGRTSLPDAGRCRCGAVFGDEATTFNCNECGSVLPIEATHCFVCGVSFAAGVTYAYACPLCGTFVSATASACRCGAQFVD